ncbi:T-cell surface protein tactile isoform X2 [Protopterus annectens]|uniref:T-cell surface protein tactile isoform X2 n=1 Tax=Protopterus annectens TaxID=7888 RepID=UPI001CFA243C|nr:T-cell surface protein tactile isoform X2 [Protopterus annectens]
MVQKDVIQEHSVSRSMSDRKRQALSSVYLCFLICLVTGILEERIACPENISALLGKNVSLKCVLEARKETKLIQTQWMKQNNGKRFMVAIHNHQHGTSYNKSIPNTMLLIQNNQSSTLMLSNLKFSFSGTYWCEFVTFPSGILSSKINLSIEIEEEELPQTTIEILENESLEIPSMMNESKITGSKFWVKWNVKENGNEMTLATSDSEGNTALYEDRIQLHNWTLYLNPVKIRDDGMTLISYFKSKYKKVKGSFRIRVFGLNKSVHGDFHILNETSLVCTTWKAYPKPHVIWYRNGKPFHPEEKGVTAQQVFIDSDGLQSVRSILSLTQAAHREQWTCMAVFFLPKNETIQACFANISLPVYLGDIQMNISEDVVVHLNENLTVLCNASGSIIPVYAWMQDNQTVSNSSLLVLKNITQMEAGSYWCVAFLSGTDILKNKSFTITLEKDKELTTSTPSKITWHLSTYRTSEYPSITHSGSAGHPKNTTPESTAYGLEVTELLNTKSASKATSSKNNSEYSPAQQWTSNTKSESKATSSKNNSEYSPAQQWTSRGNRAGKSTVSLRYELSSVTYLLSAISKDTFLITRDDSSTSIKHNIQAADAITGQDGTAWPTIVTVLLLVCVILIGFAIRRWLEYKREIIDGPPPFKPPPPPLNYHAMLSHDICEGHINSYP